MGDTESVTLGPVRASIEATISVRADVTGAAPFKLPVGWLYPTEVKAEYRHHGSGGPHGWQLYYINVIGTRVSDDGVASSVGSFVVHDGDEGLEWAREFARVNTPRGPWKATT
jgi:hypothetical protein